MSSLKLEEREAYLPGVSLGEAPHLGIWMDPSKSTGCAAHGEPHAQRCRVSCWKTVRVN